MKTLKTKIAHVVGTNIHIILDEDLEGVLGQCVGIDAAYELSLEIEAKNFAFDFDRVWELYPRKIGKKSGLTWLKRNVKSKSRYEKLIQGVINYASHCKETGKDEQFILHFSTWVKRFEDWCNENIPKSMVKEGVTVSLPKISMDDVERLLSRGKGGRLELF